MTCATFRPRFSFPLNVQSGILLTVNHLQETRLRSNPRLGRIKVSPPLLPGDKPDVEQAPEIQDKVQVSADGSKKTSSKGLLKKMLAFGMMATALVGCAQPGAADAINAQQLQDPVVQEMVQPANPFELMRMDDGSVAVSADLKNDDAYVLAAGAAIRQDGGAGIVQKTEEGTTLCEQAESLGGTCLNEEQVIVEDPSGPLMIETFARENEPIHRIHAKPADGVSAGGVEMNKLPAGTEVFSDNGSGLLHHNGDLQQYPSY